jgi:hypothetical protein
LIWVALLGPAAVPAAAFAQVPPPAAKTQAAEDRAREAERAAASARRDAPPPSFGELLADVSDPELNLRYAEGQVAQGRLDLAATALERILLQRPDLDQVRLFYGAVLFRLDQLGEAEQQFRVLQGRPLPAAQQAEVTRYLDMIADRRKPLKGSFSLSAGLHYDDNRNAYPTNHEFDVLGVRFRGTGHEEGDFGKLLIGALDVTYDTGLQRTQELFGNLTFYLDDQNNVDVLDTRAVLARFGVKHKADFAVVIPSVFMNYIALEGDKYVQDGGVQLRAERPVTSNLLGFGEVTLGHEKFNDTETLPFASEQSGRYWNFRLGGRYVVDPTLAIDGWYRLRDKAAIDYEAYRGHQLAARATKTLPKRAFVIFEASFERQLYDDNDPFVSNTKRQDNDYIASVTYGQPLGDIVSYATDAPLPDGWSNVIVSLTGEYQKTGSNVPNYDYDNWRAQVLLTKRWGF